MNDSSHVEMRRLVPSDAAAYRALMLDAYRLHPDAFTASVEERSGFPLSWWQSRIEEDADAIDVVFGAWIDGQLVGAVGLRCETRPKNAHKCGLFGMYVESSATRRGIGKRLVEAVLDEADRRGTLRVVQLTVTDGNRSAQALYERCGFVVFGVEPLAMRLGDGYAGKVHMWIDLEARRANGSTSVVAREAVASHA
jgi:GNAT superfamily N-acetyltransferase